MDDLYHDYEITEKELVSNVTLPSKIFILLFCLIAIGLNFLIGTFLFAIGLGEISNFSNAVLIGAIYAPVIFMGGIIGSKYWKVFGNSAAKTNYIAFTEAKGEMGWIAKLYVRFLEKDAFVYFEGNSKDTQLKRPGSLFKVLIRISLVELGFFMTTLSLIVQPIIGALGDNIPSFYSDYQNLFNMLVGLGVSVVILGVYYPMTIILEDSNIKTFDTKTRFINVPGSQFRRKLDALVGIGALSTGWSIFNKLQDGHFILDPNYKVLDYLVWLLFIMLLSWAILFPAALFFYMGYEKLLNQFRAEAIERGVKVGVSKIRKPTEQELTTIQKVSAMTKS